MNRGSLIYFFSIALVYIAAADACTCVNAGIKDAVGSDAAIFVGQAVAAKLSESGSEVEVRFRVYKAWQNVDHGYLTVVTGLPLPGGCAISFSVGARYIVVAAGKDKLRTTTCSGTTWEDAAGDDIKNLGPPSKTFEHPADEQY